MMMLLIDKEQLQQLVLYIFLSHAPRERGCMSFSLLGGERRRVKSTALFVGKRYSLAPSPLVLFCALGRLLACFFGLLSWASTARPHYVYVSQAVPVWVLLYFCFHVSTTAYKYYLVLSLDFFSCMFFFFFSLPSFLRSVDDVVDSQQYRSYTCWHGCREREKR